MPALETMPGMRVVAEPAAIDDAQWTGDDVLVLRVAPDEAFAMGATAVELVDDHAIVEVEHGIVGAWCTFEDLRPKTEWSLPKERPVLAQGTIAGVPAKAWFPGAGENVLVLASAAHADVLAERLGWPR